MGRRRLRIVAELTKASIWLVIACYGATLWRQPSGHTVTVVRLAWLLGLTAYVAHVLLAFAAFYGWSWSVAWRATAEDAERLTGVRAGWGLWLNIAFGLVWAILAWDWHGRGSGSAPMRIGRLPNWARFSLHSFLFFMVIQGGVIFAPPAARYFTISVLVCVTLRALVSLRKGPAVTA